MLCQVNCSIDEQNQTLIFIIKLWSKSQALVSADEFKIFNHPE